MLIAILNGFNTEVSYTRHAMKTKSCFQTSLAIVEGN